MGKKSTSSTLEKSKAYLERPEKVAKADERFLHVMAITLDPRSKYKEGIIRCVVSRKGSVQVAGYVDRSVLHHVRGDSLEHFNIKNRLVIKNETKIIDQIGGKDGDFIGLEDPDIWIDKKSKLTHVYFTIPLLNKTNNQTLIHLGHAVGRNLNTLQMTMPVLMAKEGFNGAKEVSIAPLNKQGFRYNLVESAERGKDFWYSTVRVAVAHNMAKPWEYGDTVFHPAKHNISWIGGHASPGPLLPRTFIEVGKGKRLGILNGREANRKTGDKIEYGMFSVGLFIYDYEKGKIDWVSTKPFIQDSQAKTITFASQFVETGAGAGILYAHVDDSFVRPYSLNANLIKSLLP